MLKVNVLNQSGEKVSTLNLNENVFGIEPNMNVLYEVINAQRKAMRQGTHSTKTRSEVRGGGRKPWRQKGTGRARHGSRRSPIWRGGGITFGPKPRDYAVKVNQKVKRLAFKSALSLRLKNEQLIVLDKVELSEIKTKDFQIIYDAIINGGRALFVDVDFNDAVALSARNIPEVLMEVASHTSVYDLANCDKVVLTKEAVKYFEEVLLND